MFKLLFAVSCVVLCAQAAPAPAPGLVASPLLATATSHQVVARNYNAQLHYAAAPLALHPAATPLAARIVSPYSAAYASPYAAAYASPYVAAYNPYVAAPAAYYV